MFLTLEDFKRASLDDLTQEASRTGFASSWGDRRSHSAVSADSRCGVSWPRQIPEATHHRSSARRRSRRRRAAPAASTLIVEDRGDMGRPPVAARAQESSNLVDDLAQRLASLEQSVHRRGGRSSGWPRSSARTSPGLPRRRPHRPACSRGSKLQRRLRDAAGLPRLALRQRLQPVRPDLAGHRPGRARVPRPDRRHPPASGPERSRGRWSRSGPWPRSARSTARWS